MKKISSFAAAFFTFLILSAQQSKTENVVIITLDGMRWQEIFLGADSLLAFDTTSTYNEGFVQKNFWAFNEQERRKKLLPFFWSTIATKGTLLGNRTLGSFVNNANPFWFSYPGYNEIFTGFPDTAVNSNDKIANKNVNVLEFLNTLPGFKGRVAAYCSWDVFSFILNASRSGVYVNDGFRNASGQLTEKEKLLNRLQHESPDLFHGGERLDVFTFELGFEYMKTKKPKVMYFGFGDTDEFAHAGAYDMYLDAAHKTDTWIREIWEYIQHTPAYMNKTTLLITTDHGRGAAQDGNWKHHGAKINDAGEIWIAAIGPTVPPAGEIHNGEQLYQGQIAATIASLLGYRFLPAHATLPVIKQFNK
ncbi:MAG TPA: hypothetical protein VM012_04755 [Flavitalea sp.]|nr:hypothetical protein [Flavitalea sp.]